MRHPFLNRQYFFIALALVPLVMIGCKRGEQAVEPAVVKETPVASVPQSYEATADELLEARLPAEEASQGWVRLFDGQTLFGWEITGAANWRVEDGSIVVDHGEKCLLCTSVSWQDYELVVDFKADAKTNSGVFLRTPLETDDVALECYEVNIAPADNPFPTGGVAQRKKGEELVENADQWRTMKMLLDGNVLTV